MLDCASPIRTDCGSLHSPRTPPVVKFKTSNCGIADVPAATTGSETPKALGLRTFRCTASTRTGSGSPSSN